MNLKLIGIILSLGISSVTLSGCVDNMDHHDAQPASISNQTSGGHLMGTPVPTQNVPLEKSTTNITPVKQTIDISKPFRVKALGYPSAVNNIEDFSKKSDKVIVGKIYHIDASRWTTSDGKRPANPFARDNKYNIYTPVIVQVMEYYKGESSDSLITVFAWGGTVGQDYEGTDDRVNEFTEGEQVILFLHPMVQDFDSHKLWQIVAHYKVEQTGDLTNAQAPYPHIAREELKLRVKH